MRSGVVRHGKVWLGEVRKIGWVQGVALGSLTLIRNDPVGYVLLIFTIVGSY